MTCFANPPSDKRSNQIYSCGVIPIPPPPICRQQQFPARRVFLSRTESWQKKASAQQLRIRLSFDMSRKLLETCPRLLPTLLGIHQAQTLVSQAKNESLHRQMTA